MDRLQAELVAAHQESQCVRQKLRLLENDVAEYRQKNVDLSEELLRRPDTDITKDKDKSSENDNADDKGDDEDEDDEDEDDEDDDNSEQIAQLEGQVKEMMEKMEEMKTEMQQLRRERDQLEEERAEMEAEREEEMKIVQDALEEVNEEKTLIRSEFETFRTVNTDREQKLLDDFEWKLREVEQTCKRRVEEKERRANETIHGMEAKIKEAEERLSEIERLRAYETEVVQLRGISRDQQRSLRHATNKTEELQVSELILKEEVSQLRASLDKEKAKVAAMILSNDKRITELERQCVARVESQKSEMNDQWEHRLRRECLRLKTELDQLHEEEKHLAIEAIKIQKDQEVQAAKQSWERRLQDALKEVSTLKIRAAEKEAHFQKEMERAQTNADRDILEMRRKLDKMDMTYQGQIEKLKENHEKEMEQLNWEVGRKIHQMEQNYQLQNSSTRTTLELVKEQMERDAQSRLESAAYQHRLELEEQWERLEQAKVEETQRLEENHVKQLQKVKSEFEATMKSFSSRESALVAQNVTLEEQLRETNVRAGQLAGNANTLQSSVQALNQQMTQTQLQADNALRVREAQLEAEKEAELAQLRAEHATEQAHWQAQYKAMEVELGSKIDRLALSVAQLEQEVSIRNVDKCDNEQQTAAPDEITMCDNEQQTSILDDVILKCDNEQQTLVPDEIVKCDYEQQTSIIDEIVKFDNEQQTSVIDDIVKCDNEQQTSVIDDIVKYDHAQQTSIPDEIVKCDNEQQTSILDDIAVTSRAEDLLLIAELRRIIVMRERELASVTEEKTFYEQELLSHEASCNNTNIVSECYTGVLHPHKYTTHRPRKKGGGRGGTTPLAKSASQPLVDQAFNQEPDISPAVNLSRSRSTEYPAIKVPSRSPIRKAKKSNKASNGITISTL